MEDEEQNGTRDNGDEYAFKCLLKLLFFIHIISIVEVDPPNYYEDGRVDECAIEE